MVVPSDMPGMDYMTAYPMVESDPMIKVIFVPTICYARGDINIIQSLKTNFLTCTLVLLWDA